MYNNFSNYATGSQPYELVTAPKIFPISLSDAKNYLKITTNADDNLINMMIRAATKSAESYTKRDFITKSYTTYRDIFGDYNENPLVIGYPSSVPYGLMSAAPIVLRKSPLVEIDSISYLSDGDTVVLDDTYYRVIKKNSYSQIVPTSGRFWPVADYEQQAVTIVFSAGYGESADLIPADIKDAILQMVANYYVNRGDFSDESKSIPAIARTILNQYTIRSMVP
jgi:hypothetical protein